MVYILYMFSYKTCMNTYALYICLIMFIKHMYWNLTIYICILYVCSIYFNCYYQSSEHNTRWHSIRLFVVCVVLYTYSCASALLHTCLYAYGCSSSLCAHPELFILMLSTLSFARCKTSWLVRTSLAVAALGIAPSLLQGWQTPMILAP